MARRYRFVLRPAWLALVALVAAAVVTMVLLGRWQWHVAHVHHGSVQNYSYAFQWWIFAVFAVLMLARVLRDHAATPGPLPERPVAIVEPDVPYRRYAMPTTPQPPADDYAREYNDYLASLAGEEEQR